MGELSLDGEFSPTNGIDTDKDTLTDWEEVKVDIVEVNEALNATI